MKRSSVILITGLPGTGKTTLGRKLSDQLKWPFITKDAVKERLFDNLGWSDREWSRKLGLTSYRLLDYFVEEELKAGRSIIIESNFSPKLDTERFRNWQKAYHTEIIQIVCHADKEILFERFKQRAVSGERHPGHVDAGNLEEVRSIYEQDECKPLELGGKVIHIDTTDFSRVSEEDILREIESSKI